MWIPEEEIDACPTRKFERDPFFRSISPSLPWQMARYISVTTKPNTCKEITKATNAWIDLVCHSLTQVHWFAIEKCIKLRLLMQPAQMIKEVVQKIVKRATNMQGRDPKHIRKLMTRGHMVLFKFMNRVIMHISSVTICQFK